MDPKASVVLFCGHFENNRQTDLGPFEGALIRIQGIWDLSTPVALTPDPAKDSTTTDEKQTDPKCPSLQQDQELHLRALKSSAYSVFRCSLQRMILIRKLSH